MYLSLLGERYSALTPGTPIPSRFGVVAKSSAETTVFAQGYGLGHTVMFSFSLDPSKLPMALSNRICTRFHGLEASTEAGTFPDAGAMRQALWKAVDVVWPQCLADPGIDDVGAVVGINSSGGSHGGMCWKVYHHPLFPRYLQCLSDAEGGLLL